ncbi:HEAT repeat domain-containing protein [Dactylosporangium sp. NBC_01737]|uniref:HEAT repeat domain-containing protein n=1 Tax=Dactylosporangium sp. NBC_01737 TaxID=2975959 RepID=UPI002E160E3D|nr:HEAT repeat domain-containing protein [Dactylosporangium sp. NBC_01737]
MLDGLDDIDWASLEHAYGPATDVPGHVRGLLAGSPEERRRALSGLYGGICHQGTRYEASAPAVPFLLEVLQDPATPDRAAIMGLVSAIAVGQHEAWLPGGFPVAELRAAATGGAQLLQAAPPPAEDDEDEDDEDFEDGDFEGGSRLDYWESLDEAQQQAFAAYVDVAAYDAVGAGQPVLRELLADGDAAVRAGAAFTLGWFGEDASANVAALTGAVGDPSRSVAATALVALGLLGTAMPAALQDPKAEIRWGTAIALARLHGAGTPADAVAELLGWAGGASTARAGIPFLGGDLAGYAALSLPGLGDAYAAAALDALLARLGSVTGVETLPVLGTALRVVFPDGPRPAGAPLDAAQRRLAAALAGAPAAWQFDGRRFGNVTGLVRAYGLPGDPDELRVLAG